VFSGSKTTTGKSVADITVSMEEHDDGDYVGAHATASAKARVGGMTANDDPL